MNNAAIIISNEITQVQTLINSKSLLDQILVRLFKLKKAAVLSLVILSF